MFKTTVGLLLALVSLPVLAQTQNFCQERAQPRFAQLHVAQEANRLSFVNGGGLMNGGVCWWHSRFTRNAAYVARFRPDLPKPSIPEAKRLIHAIRSGSAIVDVPGYSDLQTFSIDFQNEIQKKLEEWQTADGIGRGDWIRGLQGRTSENPAKLATMMDELYQRVMVKQELVYQKLQLPGITSHAWLVIHMVKEANGYLLTIADSNYLTLKTKRYTRGSTQMMYGNNGFVPYTEFSDELVNLEKVVSQACRRQQLY